MSDGESSELESSDEYSEEEVPVKRKEKNKTKTKNPGSYFFLDEAEESEEDFVGDGDEFDDEDDENDALLNDPFINDDDDEEEFDNAFAIESKLRRKRYRAERRRERKAEKEKLRGERAKLKQEIERLKERRQLEKRLRELDEVAPSSSPSSSSSSLPSSSKRPRLDRPESREREQERALIKEKMAKQQRRQEERLKEKALELQRSKKSASSNNNNNNNNNNNKSVTSRVAKSRSLSPLTRKSTTSKTSLSAPRQTLSSKLSQLKSQKSTSSSLSSTKSKLKPTTTNTRTTKEGSEDAIDLKKIAKTIDRRFKEANYGKPDVKRALFCLKTLEKCRPTKDDLMQSLDLCATLQKYKKTAKHVKIRFHCQRICKYWKALTKDKHATLPPIPSNLLSNTSSRKRKQAPTSKPKNNIGHSSSFSSSSSYTSPTSRPLKRAKQDIQQSDRARSASPRVGTAALVSNRTKSSGSKLKPGSSLSNTVAKTAPKKISGGLGAALTKSKVPPKTNGPGKSGFSRGLSLSNAQDFRHKWLGLQKRTKEALAQNPPNVDLAMVQLRELNILKPTSSMLDEAIQGGLVADIKRYRQHDSRKISVISSEIFDKYKKVQTNATVEHHKKGKRR